MGRDGHIVYSKCFSQEIFNCDCDCLAQFWAVVVTHRCASPSSNITNLVAVTAAVATQTHSFTRAHIAPHTAHVLKAFLVDEEYIERARIFMSDDHTTDIYV